MKMLEFIAIYSGYVQALRQKNTVNIIVFCADVTKHREYQHFGLQHAKNIANSGVLG